MTEVLIFFGGAMFGAIIYRFFVFPPLVRAMKRIADTADARVKDLQDVVDHMKWALGGHIRKPTDPPVYTMPPGQPRGRSCDEARLAWMDKCQEAADYCRAHGLDGDQFFPVVVAAAQTDFGQSTLDPKSLAASMRKQS